MTGSSELKEADLLDLLACLYKLGTDKACYRWIFMLKRKRTATSIAEFKSYLTLNHGFKEVATSFGIMKLSTKISIHRHMKEPQFPNGRIVVCNTQDEWLIYRDFLSDKKSHELIGSPVCKLNKMRGTDGMPTRKSTRSRNQVKDNNFVLV